MIKNGKSVLTVGIYLQNVRTVLREAIEDGLMPKDAYPFGKRKYQIPSSRNVKKALSMSEIEKIVKYPVKTPSQGRPRDFWILTYLCNGINVKDLAKLKNKNIHGGVITFIRSKIERSTKQDLKPIVVVIIPEIEAIIKK